jgi:DNA-binding MarR family transcriptional regulator
MLEKISQYLQHLQRQDTLAGLYKPDHRNPGAETNKAQGDVAAYYTTLSDEARELARALGKSDEPAGMNFPQDPLAGLSDQDRKQVEDLMNQINRLLGLAPGKPLSEDQKKQLAAINDKIDKILGKYPDDGEFDPLRGLSGEDRDKLQALFKEMDKVLGLDSDQGLTPAQRKRLTALEDKIDGILAKYELSSMEKLLAGLSGQDREKVTSLFEKMDALLSKSLDKPLTDEQKKAVDAIADKINAIFAQDDARQADEILKGLSDEDREAAQDLFKQMGRLLAQESELGPEQMKKLAALESRLNSILAGHEPQDENDLLSALSQDDRQRLENLFQVMDRALDQAGSQALAPGRGKGLDDAYREIEALFTKARGQAAELEG